MNIGYTLDMSTGLAIVHPAPRMFAPKVTGVGELVYRCHSCGDLIPKYWEVLFWDPAGDWLSEILPPVMPPTMTTHHIHHMTEEA